MFFACVHVRVIALWYKYLITAFHIILSVYEVSSLLNQKKKNKKKKEKEKKRKKKERTCNVAGLLQGSPADLAMLLSISTVDRIIPDFAS